MKVYLLGNEEGYSGHVFSTEQNARAYLDAKPTSFMRQFYYIEVVEIDSALSDLAPLV